MVGVYLLSPAGPAEQREKMLRHLLQNVRGEWDECRDVSRTLAVVVLSCFAKEKSNWNVGGISLGTHGPTNL